MLCNIIFNKFPFKSFSSRSKFIIVLYCFAFILKILDLWACSHLRLFHSYFKFLPFVVLCQNSNHVRLFNVYLKILCLSGLCVSFIVMLGSFNVMVYLMPPHSTHWHFYKPHVQTQITAGMANYSPVFELGIL